MAKAAAMPTSRAKLAWAGIAALAAVAVAAAPGGAAPTAKTTWDKPVLVNATKAHRETSLALNPHNPKQLFACDPSGVPAREAHQSYFYRSGDAGKHWAYTTVETSATDTRSYAFEGGDCDVAYDAAGTMYTADTWVGNLSVGHSSDGGKTWTGTALSVSSPVIDRPWLVGGPAGTVYLTYHDVQCCMPAAMWFAKSTDYGATFTTAVPMVTPSADGAYLWEGNPVVAPGGRDLYLAYSRRLGGVANAGTGMVMELTSSHDGGASWSSQVIARIPEETASIYPSLGLDEGGYLHVVWSAPRDSDVPIMYTMSKDRGATWTKPKALVSHQTGYAPWVAGGKRGQAAIAWLGSPSVPPIDVDSDWYFYWARVDNGRVTSGRTTREPLWTGKQAAPEFEMVRLDAHGKMHLGMSVYVKNNTWAVYYQREH